MKAIIIGADGQLGTDLMRVIPAPSRIPLTVKDIDITERPRVYEVLRKIPCDIIINTAAYNDVDAAEENPEVAFSVNFFGVKNIADFCSETQTALVHFGTDFVFGKDAERKKPYAEEDREAPVNIYGISKLCGEKYVQARLARYFVIRTAVLYGTAGLLGKGGNFIETMIRLGRTQPEVRVVSDQFVSPTYSRNLAECLWDLVQTKKFGLYHMVSTGGCSRYEFVKKMYDILSLDARCISVRTGETPARARRPAYSILDNSKYNSLGLRPMRGWEENLRLYLAEKGYLK